jgi:hypothetical protein
MKEGPGNEAVITFNHTREEEEEEDRELHHS